MIICDMKIKRKEKDDCNQKHLLSLLVVVFFLSPSHDGDFVSYIVAWKNIENLLERQRLTSVTNWLFVAVFTRDRACRGRNLHRSCGDQNRRGY